MGFTEQTRRQSFNKTKDTINGRHKEIYEVLQANPAGLSAWDIASLTGRPVYVVRPRLTELKSYGLIKADSEKHYEGTDRNEAVWKLIDEHEFDANGQGTLFKENLND